MIHLARAGWLRWRDDLPDKPVRPGKSPLAFRLALDDFSPDKNHSALIDLADYVKIDFRTSDPAARQDCTPQSAAIGR